MAAPKTLTPQQRTMRARMAAHARWSRTPERTEATAKSRQAFMDRFDREVDPDGTLPPDVRAKLAESARSRYFTSLAYKSSMARRAA